MEWQRVLLVCHPINSVKALKEPQSTDANRGTSIIGPRSSLIHRLTPDNTPYMLALQSENPTANVYELNRGARNLLQNQKNIIHSNKNDNTKERLHLHTNL